MTRRPFCRIARSSGLTALRGRRAGQAIAAQLYEEFGFDTVDAGPLSEGWRFENGTPAYCARLNKAHLEKALAAASRKGP